MKTIRPGERFRVYDRIYEIEVEADLEDFYIMKVERKPYKFRGILKRIKNKFKKTFGYIWGAK
jgi:hypothetical protein